MGLSDVDPERLAQANERIEKSLARRVQKGDIEADASAAALGRLLLHSSIDAVADYRLVIEAATEREEVEAFLDAIDGDDDVQTVYVGLAAE